MKKILRLCIIFASLFFNLKVKAFNIEYVYNSDIFSGRFIGENTHVGKYTNINVDGITAYGLNPGVGYGDNLEINNELFNNITKENLEYLKLVSYYGYSDQYNEMYDYMAAQELIWRKIHGIEVVWTYKNGNYINIEEYKNRIINSINEFYIKPSFDGQKIVGEYNEIVELVDTNGVLKNYNIEYSGKNEVWKEGNKLFIRLKNKDFESIKLVKSVKNNVKDTYYTDVWKRDVVVLGMDVQVETTLEAKAKNYNNKIKISFNDSKTNNLIKEEIVFKIKNLDTNEYYVYNNNNIFSSNNGIYLSQFNLDEGQYEIESLLVPDNYHISNTRFEINYNSDDDQPLDIECKLDRKMGHVIISRSFKDGNQYYQIANINYKMYVAKDIIDSNGSIIYYENELVDTFSTDDKGIGKSKNIEIGDYYIIEDNNNYSPYSNKIYVSILNNGDVLFSEQKINISTDYNFLHININKKDNNIDDKYALYAYEDIQLYENKLYRKNELVRTFEWIDNNYIEEILLLPYGLYYVRKIDDLNSNIYFIDYNENNSNFNITVVKEILNEETKEDNDFVDKKENSKLEDGDKNQEADSDVNKEENSKSEDKNPKKEAVVKINKEEKTESKAENTKLFETSEKLKKEKTENIYSTKKNELANLIYSNNSQLINKEKHFLKNNSETLLNNISDEQNQNTSKESIIRDKESKDKINVLNINKKYPRYYIIFILILIILVAILKSKGNVNRNNS